MSFWRDDVIQHALDQETRKHIDEQLAWIAREPANPHPYLHLAELYRMEGRQDEALGLMLHAVQLDASFIAAHAALSEVYAVRGDYAASWRLAEGGGELHPTELLRKYGIPEP